MPEKTIAITQASSLLDVLRRNGFEFDRDDAMAKIYQTSGNKLEVAIYKKILSNFFKHNTGEVLRILKTLGITAEKKA
jgi:hypothetical protein